MKKTGVLVTAAAGVFSIVAGFMLGRSPLKSSQKIHREITDVSQEVASEVYKAKNLSKEQSFLDYCRRSPRTAETRTSVLMALDEWLADDPVDCVETLLSRSALVLVDEDLITSATAQACRTDPDGMFRKALGMRSQRFKSRLMTQALEAAFRESPESGLELLGSVPRAFRLHAETELGKSLSVVADKALLHKLLRSPQASGSLFKTALRGWLGRDSRGALTFIQEIDQATLQKFEISRNDLFASVAADADPNELLSVLSLLPEETAETATMKQRALSKILVSEPSRSAEVLSVTRGEIERASVLAGAAVVVVAESPERATQLLHQVPGERRRAIAAGRAVRALYRNDQRNPDRALRWLRATTDIAISQGIVNELLELGVRVPSETGSFIAEPYVGEQLNVN